MSNSKNDLYGDVTNSFDDAISLKMKLRKATDSLIIAVEFFADGTKELKNTLVDLRGHAICLENNMTRLNTKQYLDELTEYIGAARLDVQYRDLQQIIQNNTSHIPIQVRKYSDSTRKNQSE